MDLRHIRLEVTADSVAAIAHADPSVTARGATAAREARDAFFEQHRAIFTGAAFKGL